MKYTIALLLIGFSSFCIAQNAVSIAELQLSPEQLSSYEVSSTDIEVAYLIADLDNTDQINALNSKLRADFARAGLRQMNGEVRFFSYGPNKETVCDCSAKPTEKLIYYLKTDGEYNCKVVK